jgi:GT2 family glycosyltransferase
VKQDLRRRDGEDIDTIARKVLAYEIDFRRLAAEAFSNRVSHRQQAAQMNALLGYVKQELDRYADAVERTIWWRLRKRVRRLMKRPEDIVRPALAQASHIAAAYDRYRKWLEMNAPRPADLERMGAVASFLNYRPTFSILMPAYQTPEKYLRSAIESVLGQAYPHWELCIVDDASPSDHVVTVVREYGVADPRVRLIVRTENGHIAQASNDALEIATGDFVALLDHDDLLSPDALFENAIALNERPDLDFIYSDEDKVDDAGRRAEPFFKPDWSPDTFLTKMYTSHLAVFRRSLLQELGGFRAGFDGAQDYDLVLRVTERSKRIHHIAKVLYSWRLHTNSTSQNPASKDYAYASSMRAIQAALDRRDEGGCVSPAAAGLGHWSVRYPVRAFERVSVIVPTRNGAFDVRRCLDSLFALTTYPNYEVVLLDNGSDQQAALDLFAEYQKREPVRFRYLRHDAPFNFSEINNFAARQASGGFLLFLNNDTEILDGDWMTAMVEYAQRPTVGAVGAKLIYGNGTIQHAGVVIGVGGIAGHSHRHQPRSTGGYANSVALVTNYSAVTAACMMVRRELFDSVGGFDESFSIAYNDVDLCLRLREGGYDNVYLPHVELMHYESRSRGYDVTPDQIERDKRERVRLQKRWQQAWSADPLYSPHLSLSSEGFEMAPP